MKAVLQRVSSARVRINGTVCGEIQTGFLVLLGVMEGDTPKEADYLAAKIAGLRVFTDAQDKMNLSLADVDGGVLLISNFTLGADCRKGRRPSFVRAARPETAEPLYRYTGEQLVKNGVSQVEYGVFGADMQVELCNDGPVTILLDTDELNVN